MTIDVDALYRAEAPRLRRYLAARVDVDTVDDLLSATFEKALTAADRTVADNLAGWLSTIARRTVVDYWRRRDVERRALPLLVSVDPWRAPDPADLDYDSSPLAAAVASLPRRRREAIEGRVAGETPTETAARLGVSRVAVSVALMRAQRQLAEVVDA
jgi:RNA polymerase sigma-70 factor (ECF subfamily)